MCACNVGWFHSAASQHGGWASNSGQSRWDFYEQSDTVTGLSLSTSHSPVSIIPPLLHTHPFIYQARYIMFLSHYFSFPCLYHSTNASYPFIHLPSTLYNVSLPVLEFSPVSTIPPMLLTHSYTYYPHYIMFLSQYFSFPLSVSFHQLSIPIHSPTTHTI